MKKISRCGECGSKDIGFQNAKGRFFPFEAFNKVKLEVDLSLCQCSNCGSTILGPGDGARLDDALELSIKKSVAAYIGNIIKKTAWKQSEMADYVGFTPVYISELKNGKRIPEFKTYNYIKILSECSGAIEIVVEDDPRCTQKKFQVNFLKDGVESLEGLGGNFAKSVKVKCDEETEASRNEKIEAAESNDFSFAMAA